MSLTTAYQFTPQSTPDEIQSLLPSCSQVERQEAGKSIHLHLVRTAWLDDTEIGRLLIITGKYRVQNISVQWHCRPEIFEQLCSLQMDRLLWLERL